MKPILDNLYSRLASILGCPGHLKGDNSKRLTFLTSLKSQRSNSKAVSLSSWTTKNFGQTNKTVLLFGLIMWQNTTSSFMYPLFLLNMLSYLIWVTWTEMLNIFTLWKNPIPEWLYPVRSISTPYSLKMHCKKHTIVFCSCKNFFI